MTFEDDQRLRVLRAQVQTADDHYRRTCELNLDDYHQLVAWALRQDRLNEYHGLREELGT